MERSYLKQNLCTGSSPVSGLHCATLTLSLLSVPFVLEWECRGGREQRSRSHLLICLSVKNNCGDAATEPFLIAFFIFIFLIVWVAFEIPCSFWRQGSCAQDARWCRWMAVGCLFASLPLPTQRSWVWRPNSVWSPPPPYLNISN